MPEIEGGEGVENAILEYMNLLENKVVFKEILYLIYSIICNFCNIIEVEKLGFIP